MKGGIPRLRSSRARTSARLSPRRRAALVGETLRFTSPTSSHNPGQRSLSDAQHSPASLTSNKSVNRISGWTRRMSRSADMAALQSVGSPRILAAPCSDIYALGASKAQGEGAPSASRPCEPIAPTDASSRPQKDATETVAPWRSAFRHPRRPQGLRIVGLARAACLPTSEPHRTTKSSCRFRARDSPSTTSRSRSSPAGCAHTECRATHRGT